MSRSGSGRWRLHSDLSLEVMPLVASSDVRAPAVVDRSYDYGSGMGARALGRLEYRGLPLLAAGYRSCWTGTLNGASSSHLTQFVTVEARVPLPAGLSVGASYVLYLQRSAYPDGAVAHESRPAFSVFIASGP